MKTNTENYADMFEQNTRRSAELEKHLQEYGLKKELNDEDKQTIIDLKTELHKINNWFTKDM